jgi:hypothetical protein
MVTHAQPVLYPVDLSECEALDALSRAFGARHVSVQEIRRADGHNPQPDPRP